jgi:hypothetical protein
MDVNHPAIDASQRCCRLRRYFLSIGIVSTVLFVLMGVFSTTAALLNIDGSFPHPKLDALIMAIFWSCFALLGGWLILAYYRCRLCITDECVSDVGCIWTTAIQFGSVTLLVWRLRPAGGSVVLRTATTKVKIGFGHFTNDERREISSFLHERFDPEIQRGWSDFVDRFLIPRVERQIDPRIAVAAILLLAAWPVGASIYLWREGSGVWYFVLVMMNAFAVAGYLWRSRVRHRQRSKTHTLSG